MVIEGLGRYDHHLLLRDIRPVMWLGYKMIFLENGCKVMLFMVQNNILILIYMQSQISDLIMKLHVSPYHLR